MTVSEMITALSAGIDAGDWTADSPIVLTAIGLAHVPALLPAWYEDIGRTDGRLVLAWGSSRPDGREAVCTIEQRRGGA